MKVNKKLKFVMKLAIVSVVWGLVYFLYVMPCVGVLFNFNFLSQEAWNDKWLAFVNYNWRIRALPDVLLVAMMILWIPLYFVGLFLFAKMKWTIFTFKPKPKTVVKRALDIKKEKPQYAKPRSMPSTIQVNNYVAPQLPGQEKQEAKSTGTKSHKNVLQMIKQMAVIARKFKVEIFQHILLEGYKVPMAISTAARAMMIEIVNAKDANWTVDFSDDILESGWYSQNVIMEKMALDLIKASEALERAEPGSEVVKVICLTDGRILNAKQTVDYFKQHDIHLICFNNGLPKTDIIDYASFISSYFDLKEGETDPALVKLEKVPLKKREAPAVTAVSTPNQGAGDTSTELVVELPEVVVPNPAVVESAPSTSSVKNDSDPQILIDGMPNFGVIDEKDIPVAVSNAFNPPVDLPEQKLIDEDSSKDAPNIVTAVAKG